MTPSPRRLRMLDTNIASAVVRGQPEVLERLRIHAPQAIALSSITEAELRFGLARRPQAKALAAAVSALLAHVQVLPWDRRAAECYGPLRATLESAGQPMGNLDLLIAAHALAVDATLVTNDRAFNRVPGLECEDWIGPTAPRGNR